MRLGLIGAGPWGRNFIKTIATLPGVKLAAVASRSPATRNILDPACALFTDWRQVAQAQDLDGVIIATPPALHASMTAACLEAGRPVLVEKPLAMDPAAARDLLELARKMKGYVLVDHIYLFHPAYIELKNRARGLGPPSFISSAGGNKGPFRPDALPLWDYGPHDVALCLDFLGEKPKTVEARFRPQKEGELIDLRLDFSGGLQARLCVGNGMPRRERMFCVRWRDQALTLNDQGPRPLTLSRLDPYGKPKGNGVEIKVEQTRPLAKAVEAFASAIRAGSKDLSSLELGVSVVEILARCEALRR